MGERWAVGRGKGERLDGMDREGRFIPTAGSGDLKAGGDHPDRGVPPAATGARSTTPASSANTGTGLPLARPLRLPLRSPPTQATEGDLSTAKAPAGREQRGQLAPPPRMRSERVLHGTATATTAVLSDPGRACSCARWKSGHGHHLNGGRSGGGAGAARNVAWVRAYFIRPPYRPAAASLIHHSPPVLPGILARQ